MSQVTIRIPMPLRGYTQGAGEVPVQAASVREALTALGAAHEGVLERVMGPQGELRQFVNVFVGSRNVRSLEGLATPLADGDVLAIVPAVAGGDGTTPEAPSALPPQGGPVHPDPSTSSGQGTPDGVSKDTRGPAKPDPRCPLDRCSAWSDGHESP